jgi:hypothetical protein
VNQQTAQWRIHECLLDLVQETQFADGCIERNRRPLLLVWGDSTAGALMPGLLSAQQGHDFGIAQLTASSCVPIINTDIAGAPNCRANNNRVLAQVKQIKPDIVLLHGTWEKYLDHAAETVAALKATGARVVVLGPVPFWKYGLPNEVMRYWMLHHELIPARSDEVDADRAIDEKMRAVVAPEGAEFISARDVLCNAAGCLARLGDKASDLSASDQVHLTEEASVLLVQSIIGRVLSQTLE